MTSAVTTSSTHGRFPWLHGPAIDLLVGCGAWSLPLLSVTFFLQRQNAASVTFAFYALALLCNNPHYMATIYRAYRTPTDFNRYRFFTIYVTVLVAFTVVLVHFVPSLFPWIVTVYLTWSPWHYTGQNFGISLMFIRRTGAASDSTARQLLYGSYAASFAVWVLTLHSIRDTDSTFISLQIPESAALPLQIFFALVFVVCSLAAFIRLGQQVAVRNLVAPILLTVTQLLWFVGPALLTRFGFLELPAGYFSAGALAFMHCAQYLWITSYYARRETGSDNLRRGNPSFSFWRYYFILIVGGIALFVPGPWIASRILGHDLVESFLIFVALVNIHHFILDGAIWKLRDGRIARLLLGKNAQEASAQELELRPPTFSHHIGWLFGPTPAARTTLALLCAAILALGILDQTQYYFTQRGANERTLAQAERLNPNDPRVYYRRARQAFAAGDMATARTQLNHVLAINPRNVPAQHLLGEIIFKSGDTNAALAHYDRMAELIRPDLSLAVNRGLLARQVGQPAFAATRFEEALTIAPHKTNLHFLLAEALLASGRPDDALKQYELFATLFEEDPGPPDERDRLLPAYYATGLKLGELYSARNELHAAEKSLQHTADVAVTFHHYREAVEVFKRLSDVEEKLGKTELANKNRLAASQAAQMTPKR